MAIQSIVDFNERNLKLVSASHRLEQSEEGAPIDYGAGRTGDVKHSIASIDKAHAVFRPVCDFAGLRNDRIFQRRSRHSAEL